MIYKLNLKKIIIAGILIAFAAFLWDIGYSSEHLTVRTWEYKSAGIGKGEEIRLVLLSDLHDHSFGQENTRLIQKVREQEPDLILLIGDFLNEDSDSSQILCELVRSCNKIAPVYFSLGNHEELYIENHPQLIQELETAGAAVLDLNYADLEINGTCLRLGGMYDYAFGLNGKDEAEAAPAEVREFLEDFQDTDRLKIMMAHRPDSFIFGDAASYWDVDLVVSGHDHGGQVVVPFLGGLYGGDQGWFPEYIHGMYQKDQISIFITSGLGSNAQLLPRLNNPPEIAVIELTAETS